MEYTTWLSYVAIITPFILFPGYSTILITLHGFQYGVRKSNSTIIGNLLASLVLMAISAFGLGIIISTSMIAFIIMKYLGAIYLIYIGIKTWRKASSSEDTDSMQKGLTNTSTYLMLKQGFLTGISNPKYLIFFIALFPGFINYEKPIFTQLIILMSTWLVIDYAVKLIYASSGARISKKLSKLFQRATGGIFILFGLGLGLALNSNK